MLNLYSVKTRVIVRERWDNHLALDGTYLRFVVSDTFDKAVEYGKTLAAEHGISSCVKRQYGLTAETITLECKVEATGISVDPSVLTAQVAG